MPNLTQCRIRTRAYTARSLPVIPASSRLHSRQGFEDLVLRLRSLGLDAILENDGRCLFIQIQQTLSSCEVWMDGSRLFVMGENIEMILGAIVSSTAAILAEEGWRNFPPNTFLDRGVSRR